MWYLSFLSTLTISTTLNSISITLFCLLFVSAGHFRRPEDSKVWKIQISIISRTCKTWKLFSECTFYIWCFICLHFQCGWFICSLVFSSLYTVSLSISCFYIGILDREMRLSPGSIVNLCSHHMLVFKWDQVLCVIDQIILPIALSYLFWLWLWMLFLVPLVSMLGIWYLLLYTINNHNSQFYFHIILSSSVLLILFIVWCWYQFFVHFFIEFRFYINYYIMTGLYVSSLLFVLVFQYVYAPISRFWVVIYLVLLFLCFQTFLILFFFCPNHIYLFNASFFQMIPVWVVISIHFVFVIITSLGKISIQSVFWGISISIGSFFWNYICRKSLVNPLIHFIFLSLLMFILYCEFYILLSVLLIHISISHALGCIFYPIILGVRKDNGIVTSPLWLYNFLVPGIISSVMTWIWLLGSDVLSFISCWLNCCSIYLSMSAIVLYQYIMS